MNKLCFNRYTGISAALAVAFFTAAGCGSDSKSRNNDGPDGAAGDGGGSPDGSDGTGGGGPGDDGGGSGGTGPNVDGGTGGSVVTPEDNPDELIAAICGWEFRCCERGELDYRLGPTVADAAACTDRFVFELRESNDADNPFVSGSALGLLGTLGYQIDLNRVDINPQGLGECIAHWEDMGCNEPLPDEIPRCDGPTAGTDPCALENIFTPKLMQGDLCTPSLAEGAAGVVGNDIECVVGTTCLPGSHPDNPGENAACISRRVEDQPCSDDSVCDFGFYCSNAYGNCHAKGDLDDDCSFEDPAEPLPNAVEAQCNAGLTCNPDTLKCVPDCTDGFTCSADIQCPVGSSCIPLTVGNDETSFKVCAPIGNSASDRCDTHQDCVAGNYCDTVGGVCLPDDGVGDACSVTEQCPAGSFCKLNISLLTYSCELLGTPGDSCINEDGCVPNANECVWDGVDIRAECSATKRANGAACVGDTDCASGLCDSVATGLECSAGADAGDACDGDPFTSVAPSCGPGLACIAGECVAQLAPGGDCTDPDADVPNNQLCQNGACTMQWETTLCTDAPVPETNGGTGITCDGT